MQLIRVVIVSAGESSLFDFAVHGRHVRHGAAVGILTMDDVDGRIDQALGFVGHPGEDELAVSWAQMLDDPRAVLGMHLRYAGVDRERARTTIGAVAAVESMELGERETTLIQGMFSGRLDGAQTPSIEVHALFWEYARGEFGTDELVRRVREQHGLPPEAEQPPEPSTTVREPDPRAAAAAS